MVEWKEIGEICNPITPPKKILTKDYLDSGLFPVIDQGQNLVIAFTNDATSIVPNDEYVLFGDHTRYIKFYSGSFAQGADGLKILKVKSGILPRYFYFAFQNTDVPIRGYSRHWSIAKALQIPIPSLQEQERIVGILDTFTASIDNLKEQIAQRRKQYEHYRDQLLDLEGKPGVEMKTIGEISKLVTKQTGFDYSSKIKPELLTKKTNSSIPFLQTRNFNGRKFDYETEYYVPQHIVNQFPKIVLDSACLLLSIVGASIGNVGLFPGKTKCFLGGAICVVKFDDKAIIPYVYEQMSSWYGQRLIKRKIKGAGQATITVEDIRNFALPFPPKEEQQRIVSILDTFEASIANLEAQLTERQKQYEYYRNKLLTFE